MDLSAAAWEKKYRERKDRWDLGCPAPPLINLLASEQAPKAGRLAVLGCGSGQDAMLFASAGFDVVGFDIAPTAVERAQGTAKARNLNVRFLERNIFDLGAELPGCFDFVLEHTCFCAIDPSLRNQYVQMVTTILRPAGQLIALFSTHNQPGGPPFGIKPQEILDLFIPHFEVILFLAATDSIAYRQGKEHLAIFQARTS
jgi:SAM-dependent methyltransferase